MKTVEMNKGWQIATADVSASAELPFETPGYGKCELTAVSCEDAAHAFIDIDGARGVIDVFADGECVGSAYGDVRLPVDAGALKSGRSKISLVFEDGGAITRGVTLHTAQSDIYILPYGLFVRTLASDGERASLEVTAELFGEEGKRKLTLELSVINARGKRSCRKIKKFTFTGGDKKVTVPVKMRRAYPYESDKPYMYTLRAVLLDENGEELDASETKFGVRVQGIFEPGALIGATVPHECGIMGEASYADAEKRKLGALRDLGYNAVRYVGLPSPSALAAADELGLKVIADVFDNWTHPREGSLSHLSFGDLLAARAAYAVSVLRNHPSVVMYSAGNMCEETYGRRGSEYAAEVFGALREADPSRPVAIALGKLVPTERELIAAGAKRSELNGQSDGGLTGLGDVYGVPASLTAAIASLADVCLCSDGFAPPASKPYVRINTLPENAFESIHSAEDDENMLGDLSPSGMDSSHRGATTAGDIDHTGLPRNYGLYRPMLAGAGGSFILVGDKGAGMLEGTQCWKAAEGETVSVRVFTPGDVVALYVNDYLVGRRLAGKVNKQYASFETEYKAGKLEAVSYLRGRECDRVSLITPAEPKGISLLTGAKRISASAKDICFIDLWVTDERGEPSIDYTGDVNVTVSGEGEIVAMGCEYGRSADEDIVTAAGGHALIAVRGTAAGKCTVRAKAHGLRAGRITITVKE